MDDDIEINPARRWGFYEDGIFIEVPKRPMILADMMPPCVVIVLGRLRHIIEEPMATYSPEAIAAAQGGQAAYGTPASICLAQFDLESDCANRMPAGSNNPFGIKAWGNQPFVVSRTTEFLGGRYVVVSAKFRKFATLADAFMAHAALLGTSGYYARARECLPDVDAFADALTGVYATDPDYGTDLKKIMVRDNLYQYDTPAAAAVA